MPIPTLTVLAILVIALIFLAIGYFLGQKIGAHVANKKWENKLGDIRNDAIKRSRAVLSGQFTEQLAPYLPNFVHSPSEVRFIGKPVDFIVFKGMDEQNISEVVFVEVKTGTSKLNNQQKNLKETIQKKRVRWEEYNPTNK
ncbi:MAG: Holliday junction resolvase-like protein [Candidatus Woesearchaeota archaeon]|nr:Holliday junction resolvase-like protein [Candidatus Woesearchaeota archaeon]